MNVKKIVTIGWDIADDKGGGTHFDDHNAAPISERNRAKDLAASLLEKLKIKNSIKSIIDACKLIKQKKQFEKGEKVFVGLMQKNEAHIVSKSVPLLKEWIQSKGIELKIISDSKWQI